MTPVSPDAVVLVRGEPELPEAGGSAPRGPVLLLAAALVVLALGVVALRRARALRRDPEAYAFTGLCRRLGLTADERLEITRLAASVDAHPVALLLSVHAFEAAQAARGSGEEQAGSLRRKLRLHGST